MIRALLLMTFVVVAVVVVDSHQQQEQQQQQPQKRSLSTIEFVTAVVVEMNRIRAKYTQTPALVESSLLTHLAQNYTNRLALNNGYLVKDSADNLRQCGISLNYQLTSVMSSSTEPEMSCAESLAIVYLESEGSLDESECSPTFIVQNLWNSQRQFYNFSNPPTTISAASQFGDFTQLVWRSTRYVGVGVSFTGRACYVSARFWPAGNVLTKYSANVLGPINACESVLSHRTSLSFLLLLQLIYSIIRF